MWGSVHLAHLRRKGCALHIPQEGARVRPAGQPLAGEVTAEAQRSWAGALPPEPWLIPQPTSAKGLPGEGGPGAGEGWGRGAWRAGVSSPRFRERASFQPHVVRSGAHSSSDAFRGPSVGPGPGRRPPHAGQRGSGLSSRGWSCTARAPAPSHLPHFFLSQAWTPG